jgi:hypothetical protein
MPSYRLRLSIGTASVSQTERCETVKSRTSSNDCVD